MVEEQRWHGERLEAATVLTVVPLCELFSRFSAPAEAIGTIQTASRRALPTTEWVRPAVQPELALQSVTLGQQLL